MVHSNYEVFGRTIYYRNGQRVIPFFDIGEVPEIQHKKMYVQKWLTNKDIDFSPFETLCELRKRVKDVTPREKNYELYEIALQTGHLVIM
jgi:hypothetical protein